MDSWAVKSVFFFFIHIFSPGGRFRHFDYRIHKGMQHIRHFTFTLAPFEYTFEENLLNAHAYSVVIKVIFFSFSYN